ncbi:MAG: metallophosphoesterase family protein [Phycisphaerales bacterium JB039]
MARLLVFSDVHCDLDACRGLVEQAAGVDLVIGAGDFARKHDGLGRTIEALRAIDIQTILVPGNNETDADLRAACVSWKVATVLHGDSMEAAGLTIFGIGCGVPPLGLDWSFDLTEDQARRRLSHCPEGADVLITHSPPHGHVDRISSGRSIGSAAVLETIENTSPRLVVCGHVHDCWGQESRIGASRVINAGPRGKVVDL